MSNGRSPKRRFFFFFFFFFFRGKHANGRSWEGCQKVRMVKRKSWIPIEEPGIKMVSEINKISPALRKMKKTTTKKLHM